MSRGVRPRLGLPRFGGSQEDFLRAQRGRKDRRPEFQKFVEKRLRELARDRKKKR